MATKKWLEENDDKVRTYRRLWYKNNKEKQLLRQKVRRQKIKKWFHEYKNSLKCSKCDEDHWSCIEFHHRNPSEKEHCIGQMIGSWSIERIQSEIEKCDIICANCHRKIHFK